MASGGKFLSSIETKVWAAAGGGAGGTAVATFATWLLGVLVWHASDSAAKAGDAISAVPAPVAVPLTLLFGGLSAAALGYAAPHTAREASPQSAGSAPARPASPVSPDAAAVIAEADAIAAGQSAPSNLGGI